MPRPPTWLSLGLAGVLAAGCSGSGDPEAVPEPSASRTQPSALGSTSSPPIAEPSSEPSSEPTQPPRAVTIALAGDVHFEGVLRERLDDDPVTALAPVTSALAAADVAVVNLKTSVGEGGRPEPGKRFTFQAPQTALAALAAAGVDVATMANNHAVDFGRAALPSAFAAIEAAAAGDPPLAVVGLGQDVAQAFRPARADVDGTVVATIGATVADTDPTADPTGHWAATADTAGTADAVDPRRLLRAVARRTATRTWSSSTCTGVSRAIGARARRSRPWQPTSSTEEPTSWSAATPTCSRGTDGSVTATWRSGWATTPGTRSPPGRAPTPGC